MEGKGKLNFLFNDFANAVIDREILRNILHEAVLFAMDFELTTPPFNEVNVVTLHQIKEMSQNMKLKTAKRLGIVSLKKNNSSFFTRILPEIQKYLYLHRFYKSIFNGPFV